MDDETAALRNALIEAEKEKAGMRKRRRRQDGGEAVAGRPGPLDYLKHRVKEEPEMEAAEANELSASRRVSGSEESFVDPGNYLETVISSFSIKTEADIDRLNKIQDLIDRKMMEVASGGKRKRPSDGDDEAILEEESRPPKKKKRKKEKSEIAVAKEQLVKAAVEKVEQSRDKGRRKDLIENAKNALGVEKPKARKGKKRMVKIKEEEEEQEPVAIPEPVRDKFDWKGSIMAYLVKKGGRAKHDKLRKRVISSYQNQRVDANKTLSQLEDKFEKKLSRCKSLKMEKEYVLLVDGGNDSSITATTGEPKAIPLGSGGPPDIKAEPALSPPPCSTSFDGSGGAFLRRSSRSTRSECSYRYTPSSPASDEDLVREAFSSGDDDDGDAEFVPRYEDEEEEEEDDADAFEAAEAVKEEQQLRIADARCKEEADSTVLAGDVCAAEFAASEPAPMEEQSDDSDDSASGKLRFVNQWVCDQGESGFGDSLAEANDSSKKRFKFSTVVKSDAKDYTLVDLLGMKDLEKRCPRLRIKEAILSDQVKVEGNNPISISEKIPKYRALWSLDVGKEECVKMVVDWMKKNDFLVPDFQFMPVHPLWPNPYELEKMMEVCPDLDLGPFSTEEVASVAQRHALLIRSAKLSSKQSFHLSNILGGVGIIKKGSPYRLIASAIGIAAFVGKPMLSYRTIASIFGILNKLFQSGGNKVRTEFTPRLKRKAFRYLRERPDKYKECIRDLNLHFIMDAPSSLRRIYERESLNRLGIKKSSLGKNRQARSRPVLSCRAYRQPQLEEDECRQLLRAVMELTGSTRVTAFGARSIDWEFLSADLGKPDKKRYLRNIWGTTIFPVLSKYCAGVSVDPRESEVKILEHIRDTVDSLERVDRDELTSMFPFETQQSITSIFGRTKKRLVNTKYGKYGDFTSKMNAIIEDAAHAQPNDMKRATLCSMIARVYKEVSEELERKWAQSRQEEN